MNPGTDRRRSATAHIEPARYQAGRVLDRYAIAHPGQLAVEDIAMAEGVLVVDGPLAGAEARLLRHGARGLVRVREGIREEGRRRLTIAHELGHWLLHAQLSQLPLLCEIAGERLVEDYQGSALEIEATAFASELLLPSRFFVPMVEEVRSAPSLEAIKNISLVFNTSLMATAVRFAQHTSDCMIVFSTEGRVEWWRRAERGTRSCRLWLESRQALDEQSMAWRCQQGLEQTELAEVAFEVWFPHLNSRRPFRLFEQSMKLGDYPTVMTLLWVPEQ